MFAVAALMKKIDGDKRTDKQVRKLLIKNSEKIMRKANDVNGVYETVLIILRTSSYGQNRRRGATIPSITLSYH